MLVIKVLDPSVGGSNNERWGWNFQGVNWFARMDCFTRSVALSRMTSSVEVVLSSDCLRLSQFLPGKDYSVMPSGIRQVAPT